MKKSMLSVMALCLVLLFAVPATAADIAMSVAASLKEAATAVSSDFAKTHPGVRFQNNFGSSGALAKQIANGAPADLFFSANTEWIDYLKARKLVNDRDVVILAYNVLVFVGKPDLKVSRLEDVVRLGRIAIGSPSSVPAGQYAMDAFKKAGIEKQLENKLVMAKDVRACLLYADQGEVDGAFVYKTDAQAMAKNVKILFTVPQNLYPRVTYPVALTAEGSKKADTVAFFGYLQSPDVQNVLVKHGFMVK